MRIYTKLGDTTNSLRCQEEYFRLTDSVLNEREFIEIRNRYQGHVNAEQQGHISDLESRLMRNTLVLTVTGITLLFIVFIALLIWRQKKRLHSAYADLYERNRELLEMHDELVRQRRLSVPDRESAAKPQTPPSPPGRTPDGAEGQQDPDQPDVDPALLQRIIDLFDTGDAYLDPEFSLQTLAKLTDSNTKYVSQAINSSLGKNFRALVNEYRIKEAQRRIMDTEHYGNMTIQGIAESVGYKSPTNFIASFKKVTGITPSIFMKMTKEKKGDS